MNTIQAWQQRVTARIDRWQRRHRPVAFLVAVVKKSSDDNASHLVALLTHYAFLATFPLLLALTGVLGLVLNGHPALQERIQKSALSEFPIIGDQLHSQLGVSALSHSTPALVIGTIGAFFGGRGMANAMQHTFNTLWNVPIVDRPRFPLNTLRSFMLLLLLGAAAVVAAAVAWLAGVGQSAGLDGLPMQVLLTLVWAALDIGLFLVIFRTAIAKTVATRNLVIGAVFSGLAWLLLLNAAGLFVEHYLRRAQALAGLFGIVLGLLAWFAIQATAAILAVEADVVRVKKLWPRSLTDADPTDADRQVLVLIAQAQSRRPDQKIAVTFE